jgi:hypothetical protein
VRRPLSARHDRHQDFGFRRREPAVANVVQVLVEPAVAIGTLLVAEYLRRWSPLSIAVKTISVIISRKNAY